MSAAGDRLRKTAKAVRGIPEQGVRFGVQAVRNAALSDARTDTGGDLMLSGLHNGRKFTVITKIHKLGDVVTADVKAGPQTQRAPWFWLREGTRRGTRMRRARDARRSGRVISYQHPGTAGKGTWDRSVPEAVEQARKKFAELHRKATQ